MPGSGIFANEPGIGLIWDMSQEGECPSCSGPLQMVKARTLYLRCYACKPARSKTGESRRCRHCGESFHAAGYRVTQGQGLYCSQGCRIADKGVEAPSGFKHCLTCSTTKPVSDFANNSSKSDGKQTRCRACASIAGALHRQKSEVVELAFSRHLQRKYGITRAEYDRMVERQGGVCAICGGRPSGPDVSNRRFDVDHCHDTGRVRGLLCSACNRGIGFLGDDSARLQSAIDYLSK